MIKLREDNESWKEKIPELRTQVKQKSLPAFVVSINRCSWDMQEINQAWKMSECSRIYTVLLT